MTAGGKASERNPRSITQALSAGRPFLQERLGPLLVFVPGFNAAPMQYSTLLSRLVEVDERADDSLQNADVLPFLYPNGIFDGLRKKPDDVAADLLRLVEKHLAECELRLSDDFFGRAQLWRADHSSRGSPGARELQTTWRRRYAIEKAAAVSR